MQRNADLQRHLQPEVLVMGRAYLLGGKLEQRNECHLRPRHDDCWGRAIHLCFSRKKSDTSHDRKYDAGDFHACKCTAFGGRQNLLSVHWARILGAVYRCIRAPLWVIHLFAATQRLERFR